MSMTPELYLSGCKRRFGTSNPERMVAPVWEWMIREQHNPYGARTELGLTREYEGPGKNPDWCFHRMGIAKIEMRDGRCINIGGEHEDWYDQDFCIYNDVIVQRGSEIEIYGYPKEVFPPTDFHTATLVGNDIWLIGSLGYGDARESSAQVYILDSKTYEIHRASLSGEGPPWINGHRAVLQSDGKTIQVSKGDVMGKWGDEHWHGKNMSVYELDTHLLTWKEVTDTSSWHQYRIEYSDTRSTSKDYLKRYNWNAGEILRELGYEVHSGPCSEDSKTADDQIHSLSISDVPVRIEHFYGEIVIVIEGTVPDDLIGAMAKGLIDSLDTTKMQVTKVLRAH